jgi:hypothetical protein
MIVFWKVDQAAGGETDDELEKAEADEQRRRRFILRYFRIWNLEVDPIFETAIGRF